MLKAVGDSIAVENDFEVPGLVMANKMGVLKAVGDSIDVENDFVVPGLVTANKMGVVEPIVVAGRVGKSVGTLVVPEPVAELGFVLVG